MDCDYIYVNDHVNDTVFRGQLIIWVEYSAHERRFKESNFALVIRHVQGLEGDLLNIWIHDDSHREVRELADEIGHN